MGHCWVENEIRLCNSILAASAVSKQSQSLLGFLFFALRDAALMQKQTNTNNRKKNSKIDVVSSKTPQVMLSMLPSLLILRSEE